MQAILRTKIPLACSEAYWGKATQGRAAGGAAVAQLLGTVSEGALVAARTLAGHHEGLAQLCLVHGQVCACRRWWWALYAIKTLHIQETFHLKTSDSRAMV